MEFVARSWEAQGIASPLATAASHRLPGLLGSATSQPPSVELRSGLTIRFRGSQLFWPFRALAAGVRARDWLTAAEVGSWVARAGPAAMPDIQLRFELLTARRLGRASLLLGGCPPCDGALDRSRAVPGAVDDLSRRTHEPPLATWWLRRRRLAFPPDAARRSFHIQLGNDVRPLPSGIISRGHQTLRQLLRKERQTAHCIQEHRVGTDIEVGLNTSLVFIGRSPPTTR
jgi:hypothetical protein